MGSFLSASGSSPPLLLLQLQLSRELGPPTKGPSPALLPQLPAFPFPVSPIPSFCGGDDTGPDMLLPDGGTLSAAGLD